jgi:hypothetical protein
MRIKFPFALCAAALCLCGAGGASAEFREKEAVIYPAGFPTADVLEKTETVFAPHGWISLGLTPRLTATVDWLTTIFGVPAGAVRYQAPGEGGGRWAAELYGLYAPRTVDTDRDDDFKVKHKGGISWLHVIRTTAISERTRLHVYAGASYLRDVAYLPKDEPFLPNRHVNLWTPDAGVAIERSVNRALKLNLNAYHGNSFYYFDQDARKFVMTYGVYWSPFSSRRHPLLANVRLEVNGYWVYIRDADYHAFSVPFFPILTWQWIPGASAQ